jgi:hypothetical protein
MGIVFVAGATTQPTQAQSPDLPTIAVALAAIGKQAALDAFSEAQAIFKVGGQTGPRFVACDGS